MQINTVQSLLKIRTLLGGLLITAIAVDLIGLKRLPVGNLLPAVAVAVGLMWLSQLA